MKKHIPNLFTSLNLFCGCIALVMAFGGNYAWVVFFVILAAIFDFFDGFMARWLKAYSPLGKELDSLADMVSFGVVPSLVMFRYLSDNGSTLTPFTVINEYLPYLSFLLAIFSALRLAKFNIDERQTTGFIGLNTPANALFWISLCYGLNDLVLLPSPSLLVTLMALIIVFSLLMVAEIPMFSFKIKNLAFKGNEARYLLIVSMLASVFILHVLGISVGILLYIGLSIITSKKA